MKPPIDTPAYSYVEYPSAVFSLERHEIFPYDRFAYTVLRIGVEALYHQNLPLHMHISFADGADINNWWTFNAGIRPMENLFGPDVIGFQISTTPVAPLMLYGMSHYTTKFLFGDNEETDREKTIKNINSFFIDFSRSFMESLDVYRSSGLASCIRNFTESSNIELWDLNDCSTTYDLLIQFIANHEIAHAYTGQLTENHGTLSPQDMRAFELIVDTLATSWIYKHWIINTPDTKSYRTFIGVDTHKDSIFHNAIHVLKGQILMLMVFGYAGALLNRGRVVLDGGDVHPHALIRSMIQHTHFMTLLQSNYSHILSAYDFSRLDDYYGYYMSILAEVGFYSLGDAYALKEPSVSEDLIHAYELVEEYDIADLKKYKEIFRIASEMKERAESGKGVGFI